MKAEAESLAVTWQEPTLHAESVGEVERWLEQDGTRIDLRADYPQAFHPEGRARVASLGRDGCLLSHALTREVTAVTCAGLANLTLVGAVATHPEHRGKGLASALLRGVVEHARERRQDAVLLWSGNWGFYHRLGFEPAGTQCELVLGPARGGNLATGIRPAEARDVVALWTMHARKPLRIERTLADMALLLSIPRMRVLVLERRGVAVAYACQGKGADFTGWWHEQGGSDEDVATLIRGAMDVMDTAEATVLVPPYRSTLRAMLRPNQRTLRDGVCALRCALTEVGSADFFVDGLDSI